MAFVSVTIALPKGQTPSTVVSQVIKIDNNHVLDFKLIRISFYGLASRMFQWYPLYPSGTMH